MTSINSYEKSYLTNRRSTIDDNKYVLVIFKSDNTFIIRKKSSLHGVDENGLVSIRDRGKTYTGYCLFEGSKSEIEVAAERLDKEVNTDLESDCEAVMNISKATKQQSRQTSTTLTTFSKSSIEKGAISTTKPNNVQKKNDNGATQLKIQSLASANLDMTPTNYEVPPPTNVSAHNKRIGEISVRQGTSSVSGALREVNNVVENTKNARPTKRMLTFDDDFSEGESDDDNEDQSSESVMDLDASLPSTSTTNNRKISRPSRRDLSKTSTTTLRDKTIKRFCHGSSSLEDAGNKELTVLLKTILLAIDDLNKDAYQSSKDMKKLIVSVDKIDRKLNILYENQKKIQRALTKNKINVPLDGSEFGDENIVASDSPFKSTLIYVNSGGESVDLLQLYGVRTHMGRYVALVMDKIFTTEELSSITLEALLKDERYQIIQEAVRSRFKLNHKMLLAEWSTLHECVLQKRRNESKKRKSNLGDTNSTEPVPQPIEEEHYDD